jgi:uncharacterized protein involved in exopolysaccharide biosynthesis
MSEKNPQVIPIQYIPICDDDDEISLKDIIKTILNYKKFIIIFTLIVTFLAGLYAFLKTPIWEIKADVKLGHINYITNSGINTIYLLDPNAINVYIKNTYDNSNTEKKIPVVKSSIVKHTKDILNIQIDDFSNKQALNLLYTMIKDLKQKEKKKIDNYISNINSQIKTLLAQKELLQKQLNFLNKNLIKIKDSNNYQTTLSAISDLQDKILKINLKINELNAKLSPLNINQTQIIGKIIKYDHPIKPKKKLIIIVAFITSFILSIFMVFLIEFIKGLKEE